MTEDKKPPVTDPHQIGTTLCDGPINVIVHGPLATLTFTNVQPKLGELFVANFQLEARAVARLTMPLSTLNELKNLLVNMTETTQTPGDMGGTSTHKH